MAINTTFVNQALLELQTIDTDILHLNKRLLTTDLPQDQRNINQRIILSATCLRKALNESLEFHYSTRIDINDILQESL